MLFRKKNQKAKILAEKSFKEDPNKFAKETFAKKKTQGMPEFSADDAYTHLKKTYHEPQRNYKYTALPEML